MYWISAGITGPHIGAILGAWLYYWVNCNVDEDEYNSVKSRSVTRNNSTCSEDNNVVTPIDININTTRCQKIIEEEYEDNGETQVHKLDNNNKVINGYNNNLRASKGYQRQIVKSSSSVRDAKVQDTNRFPEHEMTRNWLGNGSISILSTPSRAPVRAHSGKTRVIPIQFSSNDEDEAQEVARIPVQRHMRRLSLF